MPQNTDDVIAHRRATVTRLYLQGVRQYQIAAEVGVSEGQISQDLAAIRTEWRQSTLMDFNDQKIQELAKIDHLESVYWEAWHDSKKPLKKKSTKMKGEVDAVARDEDKKKQKAKHLESSETTEERLGDPRYLDGAMRCIQKRCDLLGLDAPLKIANTDTEGKTVQQRTWVIQDHTGGRRVPAPDEE